MAVATMPAKTDDELSDSDREAIERTNAVPDHDHNSGGEQSLEDMAAAESEDEAGQTLLDFGDTLNLKVAGKKPTISKFKIRSVSREVKGQLGDKGDDEQVFVLVRASLDEVTTKTFRDENGRVRRKERRHVLEPVGVVRLPDDVAEGLFDQFA